MQVARAIVVGYAMLAGLALGGAAEAAGPATKDVHLTKQCNDYTGDTPSYCTITESNIDAIPKGATVWYWGPDLGVADPIMTSSVVIIDAGVGNLAKGYCIVDQRDTAHPVGMCAFSAGSGTLAGFNAFIDVSLDALSAFHWDGVYWTAGK